MLICCWFLLGGLEMWLPFNAVNRSWNIKVLISDSAEVKMSKNVGHIACGLTVWIDNGPYSTYTPIVTLLVGTWTSGLRPVAGRRVAAIVLTQRMRPLHCIRSFLRLPTGNFMGIEVCFYSFTYCKDLTFKTICFFFHIWCRFIYLPTIALTGLLV